MSTDGSDGMGAADFISDPIVPASRDFGTASMGRGEPGLPKSFTWRDETYEVRVCRGMWKASAAEGHRPGNEVYLRRHYFAIEMSDDSLWTVYFTRQAGAGKRPTARWFLYTRQPLEPT